MEIEKYYGLGIEVINNIGETLDTRPNIMHETTYISASRYGTKNSSLDIINREGKLTTRRWLDEKGNAYREVHMTNHGNPKLHPIWPHEHNFKKRKND